MGAGAAASSVSIESACGLCGRQTGDAVYEVRAEEGTAVRCLTCALQHRPLVRRSLLVSLVVGTALVAINQGNVIVQGDAGLSLAWKVPLTYAVPYCVATFGAIMNARTKRAAA